MSDYNYIVEIVESGQQQLLSGEDIGSLVEIVDTTSATTIDIIEIGPPGPPGPTGPVGATGPTGPAGSGGGGGTSLTNGSVQEVHLQSTFLRTIAADLRWDGSGAQPLRSTVTADVLRPVNWFQGVLPPTTSGYAISGIDRWFRTP